MQRRGQASVLNGSSWGSNSSEIAELRRADRIRYFTAPVGARPSKAHSPIRQQVYFRALRTIPHLTIYLGQHKTHPVRLPLANPPLIGSKFAEVLKTEEKGSDVNLASYLLLDAFRRDCEVAIMTRISRSRYV